MDTLPREVTSVSKCEIEPFKQGRRVGCYLLGKTLGEGSFAKVKEGLHIITGEKVAVKIIDKKRAREDRYISKNLRREARIHQLVRHPNIIQLYEVLETDNFYYLVMEYCAGGELLDYICSRKRLEETVARRIISQLVSAVDGMHKSGVVHRDLKIENFLLNDDEDLKIIDFGLSNTLSPESMQEYEKTGIFPQLLNTHCGSPAYAAPELLAQKKYGPQVDVWSIGINMYAMLTGFLPYMMEPFNVMEMYEKMMQRRMTPIPGFLSKPCRDLLMRLLEPVAEWRITLKQVMKHKWFSDSDHVPRSIPLGDMMYQKKELCESVLSYMKYNLKIRTKDTINAVVSNRAVHASAVYHLLVARLDRYLKEKKENNHTNKQFAKLEVIKKSNLSTDNLNNTHTNRSKRFTFRGKKIDGNSRSQQSLADNEHENEHDMSENSTNDHNEPSKEYKKLKDEHASSSASSISTSKPILSSPDQPEKINPPQRNPPQRGHRRALSSVNPNELRQAEEIHSTLRNSLCSDSKEDLFSNVTAPQPDKQPRSGSPEEPFGKSVKGIVSRKISVDVGIHELGSTNNNENNIDVAKFLPESPRRTSDETKKVKRKVSVDYQISEANVKEKKEPIPGWLITKIIKQPPLKEESVKGPEQRSSISPTSPKSRSSSTSPTETPVSRPGSTSPRSVEKHKKTIRRPETPEKLKSPDLNNNVNNTETDTEHKKISVNNRLNNFMQNNAQNTALQPGKTENSEFLLPENDADISDEIVDELIKNVRNITQNYLKDNDENTDLNRKRSENRTINNPHLDPIPSITPSEKTKHVNAIRFNKTSTKTSDSLDENNNTDNTSNNDNSIVSTEEKKPQPTAKVNTKTFRNNSIRGRILALENYEQKLRNKRVEKADVNVSPIKKITISKKTLELNVKQFQQFKGDHNKANTDTSHTNNKISNKLFNNTDNNITSPTSPLKPLELKFDFQRRKKKAYKEKQQTRSLTDVTNGNLDNVNTKPTEEQMLTPKHRCNEECTEACSEKESGEKETVKVRRYYGSSGTINTPVQKKAIIKITSHKNNNNKAHQNRTKIFLSAVKNTTTKTPNQPSPPTITNQNDVTDGKVSVTSSPVRHVPVENPLEANQCSSDSGYFGANPSTALQESGYHQTSVITKENVEYDSQKDLVSEKPKNQPVEVHSVKYRCIPVYQLEYTKTGTIHNKEGLEVISEENKQKHQQGTVNKIHRKWGSQTIEPTQDPVEHVPRSAEIINSAKKKFEKERERKMEHLKTQSRRIENSPALAFKKIRTQRQYSVESNVTETSNNKPTDQRTTYGGVNKSRTAPSTPCSSPRVYSRSSEKEKILAFTHALENAAWRKRSVLSATH